MSEPKRFQVSPADPDLTLLGEAAKILAGGGIVAFPTETVYGLGASAKSPQAIARLARLKQRPGDKPFTYHLACREDAEKIAGSIPPAALRLMERYWPGPLTLILPALADAGVETVGLRVPGSSIAQALIARVGAPLLVPSANPHGEPPAVDADQVVRYFGAEIDAVVDGGTCQIRQSSTIVRVRDEGYEVLREGIITREMVHQLIEGRFILFVCTGNTCRSPMAAALFKKHLAAKLGTSPEELEELGYRILSAGTFAAPGYPPSEHAARVSEEMGCDIRGHRSRPLTDELIASADRIYTLGHSHFQILQKMAPEVTCRLSMLCEEGIADPVGGDLETYRQCAEEIEQNVVRLLRTLG